MPITVDGSAGIVSAPGGLTSAGTTGVGYTTGAGGTVTQATSKGTGVTLNTLTGQITTNNAALAAGATIVFPVTNSLVASTDVPVLSIGPAGVGGGTSYRATVSFTSTGAFYIALTNISAGSLSDAVIINFAIIKGATS